MQRLPQYKCHKVVRAAKIADISPIDAQGNVTIVLVDPSPRQGAVGAEPLRRVVTGDWFTTHQAAEVGGYFVQYEDGYTSYSPAKAFEEGYTLIDEPAKQA